jgi:2,4-dienoyl-CoA reductase-like NADH-dependent reductase (Old Yellow Enzyme family)
MYDRTFSPLSIGSVTLPNRIARSAHATCFAENGAISDRLIQYHLERGRGGAGLSILEAAAVHPSSILSLQIWDDTNLPHYRRLKTAVEPTGMKLFQQLWHGGYNYPSVGGGPPWAVSAIPNPAMTVPPIVMTTDQVAELIAAFAAAAARVEAGGLDGVEIHAGHGYLPAQFLSPVLNDREDVYGGNFDSRLRFLRELLDAVRHAVTPGFPVGIRVSHAEHSPLLKIEDVNRAVRILEAEALIDYVNLSCGDYHDLAPIMGAMEYPSGYQLPTGRIIGAGTGVPRMVTGRFAALDDVEQVLRSGDGDLVSIVRGAIADPAIVRKYRDDRSAEVRPCIGCNQGCVAGTAAGLMRCVVNPAVGFEESLSEHLIEQVTTSRHVLVIGGGPAGMEAARVAALRGHRVVLMEAASSLGGLLNFAKRLPKLHAIGDIGLWQERELYRMGVDVRMSTYADVDDVLTEAPDAVLVATGSWPETDRLLQTADPRHVVEQRPGTRLVTPLDLADGNPGPLGKAAVVLDDVGHYDAIACIEALMAGGVEQVTYVSKHSVFTPKIAPTLRTHGAQRRLHAAGRFQYRFESLLLAIGEGQARIRPLHSMHDETIAADTLVMIGHRRSRNALWSDLRPHVRELHLIGDALSARDLEAAIREGHLAGRGIC